MGLESKERPRNGTGTVFCPREIGAEPKQETLATQATNLEDSESENEEVNDR